MTDPVSRVGQRFGIRKENITPRPRATRTKTRAFHELLREAEASPMTPTTRVNVVTTESTRYFNASEQCQARESSIRDSRPLPSKDEVMDSPVASPSNVTIRAKGKEPE